MGPQNTALSTGVVVLGKATCEDNVSEALKRPDDGGQFISLWDLFAQIEKAETAYVDEAARYLVSSLDIDPTGINYIRRRDESGAVLPLNMDARLHLLRQLSIFASQGTLFDADDRPNNEAQPTFERFGFYASDIYSFLAHNDVAISCPGDEGSDSQVFPDGRRIPSWILAYDDQAWLSRSRVAKILIAGTNDADLPQLKYDDAFWIWDEALSDAIERGTIAVTKGPGKQMLAHADVLAWCAQHGYAWPLEAPEAQPVDKSNAVLPSDQQVPSSPRDDTNKLTKREQQIRVVEEMADKLGYPHLQVPDGGQTEIRNLCNERTDLFSGGYHQFKDVWDDALKANRIRMANHNKFARR